METTALGFTTSSEVAGVGGAGVGAGDLTVPSTRCRLTVVPSASPPKNKEDFNFHIRRGGRGVTEPDLSTDGGGEGDPAASAT